MSGVVDDVVILQLPPAPQPDFELMATCMRNASQANETLAVQLGRMGNIPALDHGARILEEMRRLGERFVAVERGLGNILLRLDASEYNNRARLTNSLLATSAENQLVPLRTSRNEDLENFPSTQGDIDRLSSGEVNRILQAYGLPTVGQVAARRRELKKYLGITIAGI